MSLFKKRKPAKVAQANSPVTKPTFSHTTPQQSQQISFLPNLNDKRMTWLWLGVVCFFTLLATSLLASYTTDIYVIIRNMVETFVLCFFIVSTEVVFIGLSAERFQRLQLDIKAIGRYILITACLIIPTASLIGRLVLFLGLDYRLTVAQLAVETLANTVLGSAMLGLLIAYFNIQHQHIQQATARTQQLLIEQNEQLKARITPHFFFNILNTLQYLIETDAKQAQTLVQNVSALYRTSFDDTREVGLLDEIQLCRQYLSIEAHRFGNRLAVTWDLPDEDMLYDMVISALMVQLTIEKMIANVVELTVETVKLTISVAWVNDQVDIGILVDIPSNGREAIEKNIEENLSFNSQIDILRQFYGDTATIEFGYKNAQLDTHIRYPLKDVAF